MLVLSALVVGSLAPDFRYFLNLAPRGHFGHSLKGVFLFCLPVGLAVLWIFHKVMKLPLISLAPERHLQRLAPLAVPFRWGPALRFIVILCSLFVGAISHLAWDSFTHDRGLAVRNLPDLRSPALEEFGTHRPLYNVLQHGSSLLGMAVLIFWYWRWFQRTSPQPVPSGLQQSAVRKGWTSASLLAVAGSVSFSHAYIESSHLTSLAAFVSTFLVTFMSLVFIEALCFSLWWQWRRKHFPSSRRSSEANC
jgi:Domain of unknown function (DUF4184)